MSLSSLPDSIILKISEFLPIIVEIKPLLKEKYFKKCVLHPNQLLHTWKPSCCPICCYTSTYNKDALKKLQNSFVRKCSKSKKRKFLEI